MSRRQLLSATALAALSGLAGCTEGVAQPDDGATNPGAAAASPTETPTATETPTETATATETPTNDVFGGYLDDVDAYDSIVDRRGEATVTVTVGATGNGGGFAFAPTALHVDPGTTIRWKWTGDGGAHNVVAEDGAFDSGAVVAESGVHFEHTFAETGVFPYYCAPHKSVGMRGGVVVGDDVPARTPRPTPNDLPRFDGWLDGVEYYDGVAQTSEDRVRILVGAEGTDGPFLFSPPAVSISPGTTVVWEWTGEGGAHNVVAKDDSFTSGEVVAEAGTTFTQTFDREGVVKYYCAPHRAVGMKGVLVVE